MKTCKWFNSDETIGFDDFNILTTCIESGPLVFDYLRYLHNDFRGKERYWRFSENGDDVPVDEHSEFISDFFQLEINSKKNINALYKLLKKQYYERLHEDIGVLKSKAVSIVKEICVDFDLELNASNDIREDDLFKILDLRFNDEELPEKEKLIKFCQTVHELRGTEVFFTVNLHLYYGLSDIEDIVHELQYRRIKIFNLEMTQVMDKYASEKVICVDKDLCVIA